MVNLKRVNLPIGYMVQAALERLIPAETPLRLGTPHLHSLSSSSFKDSVRAGGLAKGLQKFIKNPRVANPTGTLGRLLKEGTSKVAGEVPKLWREAIMTRPELKGRVVVVRERGSKARVVTPLDTVVILRGHAVRDTYWPVLEALGIVDLQDGQCLSKLSSPRKGEIFYSADLSRATDTFPLALAHACLDALDAFLALRGDLLQR